VFKFNFAYYGIRTLPLDTIHTITPIYLVVEAGYKNSTCSVYVDENNALSKQKLE